MRGLFLYILVIVGALVGPRAGHSQSITEFKERLRDATTVAEFDKHFQNMITVFHEGKLTFMDSDVADVISYAQSKSFAEVVLPTVYGWGRQHVWRWPYARGDRVFYGERVAVCEAR
ncbi:MAG: hypothetical protein WDO15_09000 [Bacteroidota bacterium]